MPNKNKVESFLYWIKLETEVKGKTALQCGYTTYSLGCGQPPGLMETHCLPVLTKHTNNL